MNSTAEKRVPSFSESEIPMSADLASLFANTGQASDAELVGLFKAADALREDPEFLADYSKGLIVEDILRAMESAGLNRNTLAARIGKSRQYVGKILDEDHRANFTIETLAELSAALGVQFHVRMLPANERMIFARKLTVITEVFTAPDFPDASRDLTTAIDAECFEPRNIIPIQPNSYERTRLST